PAAGAARCDRLGHHRRSAGALCKPAAARVAGDAAGAAALSGRLLVVERAAGRRAGPCLAPRCPGQESRARHLSCGGHQLAAHRLRAAARAARPLRRWRGGRVLRAAATRTRRRGPAVVLAVALIGGLAASPYVHYDDLAMLGLACLLFLRAARGRWVIAYAIALFIAAEGFPVWQAGPVLAGELLALLLLSVPALEHHDGYTEQDEAERQHDPGFERDRQHLAVDGEPQPVDGRA